MSEDGDAAVEGLLRDLQLLQIPSPPATTSAHATPQSSSSAIQPRHIKGSGSLVMVPTLTDGVPDISPPSVLSKQHSQQRYQAAQARAADAALTGPPSDGLQVMHSGPSCAGSTVSMANTSQLVPASSIPWISGSPSIAAPSSHSAPEGQSSPGASGSSAGAAVTTRRMSDPSSALPPGAASMRRLSDPSSSAAASKSRSGRRSKSDANISIAAGYSSRRHTTDSAAASPGAADSRTHTSQSNAQSGPGSTDVSRRGTADWPAGNGTEAHRGSHSNDGGGGGSYKPRARHPTVVIPSAAVGEVLESALGSGSSGMSWGGSELGSAQTPADDVGLQQVGTEGYAACGCAAVATVSDIPCLTGLLVLVKLGGRGDMHCCRTHVSLVCRKTAVVHITHQVASMKHVLSPCACAGCLSFIGLGRCAAVS